MAVDWALASLHHLAIFSLIAILAGEIALTSGIVNARGAGILSRVDAWYGIMAAVVLAAGLGRVFLGDKGAAYYAANALFWSKMAVFALIAALSVPPTLQFIRCGVWRAPIRNSSLPPVRSPRFGVCYSCRLDCSRCCRFWRPAWRAGSVRNRPRPQALMP